MHSHPSEVQRGRRPEGPARNLGADAVSWVTQTDQEAPNGNRKLRTHSRRGLDRIPWKGELGNRVFENVSKEAWQMWVEHSKMIMNEYRLNPLDPQSQKVMEEQMEQFFFGEGAKLPEGYVAPKAKA